MPSRRILVAAFTLAAVASQIQPAPAQTGQMDKMEEHTHTPSAPSTALTVTVGDKTVSYSLSQLKAMPQKTLLVRNGHSNLDEVYSGVALTDLLATFGITTEKAGARRVYHSYLKAEGTDHYWVLYSASEVETAIHAGDAIVAISLNNEPIKEDGQFKLVSSEDKKPARWVRNLQSLTLVTVDK